jgi:hypothetical protein
MKNLMATAVWNCTMPLLRSLEFFRRFTTYMALLRSFWLPRAARFRAASNVIWLQRGGILVLLSAALPALADTTVTNDAPQDFPHTVPYELGMSDFAPGDSITIQELRGTSDRIVPGEEYCVTGSYTLNSQDEADLSFFATTTNRNATPIDAKQTMRIKKGTGTFRLIKKVAEDGYLHLTFYSRMTGQGIGGVYFGQGEWVLRDKHFRFRDITMGPADKMHLSAAGPNQVLYDYLGNPVPPPPNVDAAYTRRGLAEAMETAAQDAGVSLARLEIDDSEFPPLVGVVFAAKGDKEKFMEQVGKLAAYKSSGGVGDGDGGTRFAMNITPYLAFPPQDSQRIYRRMMLREAVLYDKINGTQ